MASIMDVAIEAGVSPTSVSHTLSGKRKVSAEIQVKVRAAMERLGYQPSRTAQNLARGKTKIIAAVVPDIGNSFFAELTKGVEAAAVSRGYNVILCTTGFDHEREIQYLRMVKSRAVDGVVYAAGAPPSNSEVHRVLGDMPMVFVDEEIPGTDFGSYVSDSEAGAKMVARHLLELGHRSVLVLDVFANTATSIRRTGSFEAAWMAGGGKRFVATKADYTERGGRDAVMPHMEALRSGEITAIFSLNDFMAIGAINHLKAEGINVPNEVSVVGFDDVLASRYMWPALTTVRQDVTALGTVATLALLSFLEGDTPLVKEQVLFPVELVVRESTAKRAGPTR
ncbi:LacI family DNA-binding transcriptional regulator [Mesorhizobium sp. B2-3-11]|uniref:LacI family DNA-binding transcriptional regulator n=1 Tax=Mesorhizobium sp. B2-3-11 TaxID=2589953 RepID=UPI0015E43AE9|nr:LacI family DNA-binding transcriptional regulator [Mesorhizobium sp. B2-3-11]